MNMSFTTSCNNYCLLCALPPPSVISFHDEDVHAILLSTTWKCIEYGGGNMHNKKSQLAMEYKLND